MPTALEDMRARMAELHDRLEAEQEAARAKFAYTLERGRAVFDAEVLARHRAARERL
jgi:hypothetical protein